MTRIVQNGSRFFVRKSAVKHTFAFRAFKKFVASRNQVKKAGVLTLQTIPIGTH